MAVQLSVFAAAKADELTRLDAELQTLAAQAFAHVRGVPFLWTMPYSAVPETIKNSVRTALGAGLFPDLPCASTHPVDPWSRAEVEFFAATPHDCGGSDIDEVPLIQRRRKARRQCNGQGPAVGAAVQPQGAAPGTNKPVLSGMPIDDLFLLVSELAPGPAVHGGSGSVLLGGGTASGQGQGAELLASQEGRGPASRAGAATDPGTQSDHLERHQQQQEQHLERQQRTPPDAAAQAARQQHGAQDHADQDPGQQQQQPQEELLGEQPAQPPHDEARVLQGRKRAPLWLNQMLPSRSRPKPAAAGAGAAQAKAGRPPLGKRACQQGLNGEPMAPPPAPAPHANHEQQPPEQTDPAQEGLPAVPAERQLQHLTGRLVAGQAQLQAPAPQGAGPSVMPESREGPTPATDGKVPDEPQRTSFVRSGALTELPFKAHRAGGAGTRVQSEGRTRLEGGRQGIGREAEDRQDPPAPPAAADSAGAIGVHQARLQQGAESGSVTKGRAEGPPEAAAAAGALELVAATAPAVALANCAGERSSQLLAPVDASTRRGPAQQTQQDQQTQTLQPCRGQPRERHPEQGPGAARHGQERQQQQQPGPRSSAHASGAAGVAVGACQGREPPGAQVLSYPLPGATPDRLTATTCPAAQGKGGAQEGTKGRKQTVASQSEPDDSTASDAVAATATAAVGADKAPRANCRNDRPERPPKAAAAPGQQGLPGNVLRDAAAALPHEHRPQLLQPAPSGPACKAGRGAVQRCADGAPDGEPGLNPAAGVQPLASASRSSSLLLGSLSTPGHQEAGSSSPPARTAERQAASPPPADPDGLQVLAETVAAEGKAGAPSHGSASVTGFAAAAAGSFAAEKVAVAVSPPSALRTTAERHAHGVGGKRPRPSPGGADGIGAADPEPGHERAMPPPLRRSGRRWQPAVRPAAAEIATSAPQVIAAAAPEAAPAPGPTPAPAARAEAEALSAPAVVSVGGAAAGEEAVQASAAESASGGKKLTGVPAVVVLKRSGRRWRPSARPTPEAARAAQAPNAAATAAGAQSETAVMEASGPSPLPAAGTEVAVAHTEGNAEASVPASEGTGRAAGSAARGDLAADVTDAAQSAGPAAAAPDRAGTAAAPGVEALTTDRALEAPSAEPDIGESPLEAAAAEGAAGAVAFRATAAGGEPSPWRVAPRQQPAQEHAAVTPTKNGNTKGSAPPAHAGAVAPAPCTVEADTKQQPQHPAGEAGVHTAGAVDVAVAANPPEAAAATSAAPEPEKAAPSPLRDTAHAHPPPRQLDSAGAGGVASEPAASSCPAATTSFFSATPSHVDSAAEAAACPSASAPATATAATTVAAHPNPCASFYASEPLPAKAASSSATALAIAAAAGAAPQDNVHPDPNTSINSDPASRGCGPQLHAPTPPAAMAATLPAAGPPPSEVPAHGTQAPGAAATHPEAKPERRYKPVAPARRPAHARNGVDLPSTHAELAAVAAAFMTAQQSAGGADGQDGEPAATTAVAAGTSQSGSAHAAGNDAAVAARAPGVASDDAAATAAASSPVATGAAHEVLAEAPGAARMPEASGEGAARQPSSEAANTASAKAMAAGAVASAAAAADGPPPVPPGGSSQSGGHAPEVGAADPEHPPQPADVDARGAAAPGAPGATRTAAAPPPAARAAAESEAHEAANGNIFGEYAPPRQPLADTATGPVRQPPAPHARRLASCAECPGASAAAAAAWMGSMPCSDGGRGDCDGKLSRRNSSGGGSGSGAEGAGGDADGSGNEGPDGGRGSCGGRQEEPGLPRTGPSGGGAVDGRQEPQIGEAEDAGMSEVEREEWRRRRAEIERQRAEAAAEREAARRARLAANAAANVALELERRIRQRLADHHQLASAAAAEAAAKEDIRTRVRDSLQQRFRKALEEHNLGKMLKQLEVLPKGAVLRTAEQRSKALKIAKIRFHPDKVTGSLEDRVYAEEVSKLLNSWNWNK